MPRPTRIAMIGGGSYGWTPRLTADIMLTPGLENADFRLLDVNPQAAEEVAAACRATAKSWDLPATFLPTADEARGLDGADFVIITISTGGLDAMQHDVHLPEKYGIFATVGDTVGPGGWSRGLRNIPVFMRIAEQTRKYCPRAPILNYTNPMTTLTKTLCLSTSAPVIGLCHGLFECYRTLMSIFGLESEDDIRANFAGVNHFFWILDFAVRGQDGYAMLARKTAKKRFAELVKEVYVDGAGFHSDKWVASELYEQYGKLPYVGDRHTCEFFSRYLAPDEGKLTQYRIRRTMVKERRTGKRRGRAWVRSLACGKAQLQRKRSRETAADIISAMSQNKQFVDVMNVPNRGQVSNLPLGSVVETLGVVNALGFTPLAAGALPRDILGVVMPHVTNQDWIVEAGMTGDWDKAFAALIQDPLCSHLSIPQVKKMGRELLEKNRRWLPQFFGRSATRKA